MIIGISEHLRKFAQDVGESDLWDAQGAKIFFAAPDPKNPNSSPTLTKEPEKFNEANFQWVDYQLLFTVKKGKEGVPTYYIFDTELKSNGVPLPPNKVFQSDSAWSGKNKHQPAGDITPGDVIREFPKVLKGPNLFPDKYVAPVYVNTKQGAIKSFSSEDFKRLFNNDFYIVVDPKTKEMKNPFGKLVGKTYSEEEEK